MRQKQVIYAKLATSLHIVLPLFPVEYLISLVDTELLIITHKTCTRLGE